MSPIAETIITGIIVIVAALLASWTVYESLINKPNKDRYE